MTRNACGVAAVVLAAGRGTRFGDASGASKVTAALDGTALVRHVVGVALDSQAVEVVVVTGHAASSISAALRGLPVRFTHNFAFADGMAGSLQAGLSALPRTCQGTLILLADMPRVRSETLDRLIARFAADPDLDAVVPCHRGRRGNPVLLGRGLFAAAHDLRGDGGARTLLGDPNRRIDLIEVDDPGVLIDVDTREALVKLRGRDS